MFGKAGKADDPLSPCFSFEPKTFSTQRLRVLPWSAPLAVPITARSPPHFLLFLISDFSQLQTTEHISVSSCDLIYKITLVCHPESLHVHHCPECNYCSSIVDELPFLGA